MQQVRIALTGLSMALAVIAAVAVGLTAVANVAEVAARYFFARPLNWASDFGAFALCVTVFMALPEVTRRHAHTALTLILERMPEHRLRAYQAFLFVVTAFIVALVAWFVGEVGLTQFRRGVLTATANQIPRWWLTGIVFLGLALSAVNFAVFARTTPQTALPHAE